MGGHLSDRIDVSDLTPDEHERFVFLLRSAEVGHRFHAGIAFVPHDRVADVGRILVEVRDVGPSLRHDAALIMARTSSADRFTFSLDDPSDPDGTDSQDEDDGPVVSGPLRRAIAYIIDSAATSVFALVVLAAIAPFEFPRAVDIAFGAAAMVVLIRPIARTGRTIGATVAGLRVVRRDDGAAPGWVASITRWIVPLVPYGVARGVAEIGVADDVELWVQWAAFAGGWVVYLWVFVSDWNQGLHDLAADTVVIREPLGPDHPLRGAARRSANGGMHHLIGH